MIYLDYQATTPLAPEAREAMLRWLGSDDGFANPHSAHRPGRAAAAAVEVARAQVAALLPAGGRVIFTSGATEAVNLAMMGRVRGSGAGTGGGNGGAGRMLVSPIEHAAVLDCARASGAAVDWLPMGGGQGEDWGVVDAGAVVAPGTDLVCLMQVNNEIGTVQPVAEMAEAAHRAGALLLCDWSQGAGKIAAPEGADMIVLSAHKMYGPKGIGALWVRDGVALTPVIHGGGQEGGLRSGTLSPALCAGFGAAAALCMTLRESDAAHVESLWTKARALLPGWRLNGSGTRRWHGNLNLCRPGLDVARLMSDCRDIAFSAGSACASGSGRPSHVLRALGLSAADTKSSIRLGFGRYTEVGAFVGALERLDAAAAEQMG